MTLRWAQRGGKFVAGASSLERGGSLRCGAQHEAKFLSRSRPMQLTRFWTACARDVAAFCFPPACLWCRALLGMDAEQSVCGPCIEALVPPLPFRCDRCSAPVGPNLDTSAGCVHCRTDPYAFESAVSLGPYEGEFGRACRVCKESHQQPLTRALAQVLAEREAPRLREWGADAVIPVPHHWSNRWESRHQAADSVAQVLGRALLVPVERNILVKVRRTKKQLELSAGARRSNLRSAFAVAGRPRLQGMRLLLADDILTTGTTAHRAAQELLRAGAGSVRVAVLARGIGAV